MVPLLGDAASSKGPCAEMPTLESPLPEDFEALHALSSPLSDNAAAETKRGQEVPLH